jgi:hypothetical protein
MSDKDKDKKVQNKDTSTNYTLPIIFSVLTLAGLVAFYFYFKVEHGTKDSEKYRGGPRAMDIFNKYNKIKL